MSKILRLGNFSYAIHCKDCSSLEDVDWTIVAIAPEHSEFSKADLWSLVKHGSLEWQDFQLTAVDLAVLALGGRTRETILKAIVAFEGAVLAEFSVKSKNDGWLRLVASKVPLGVRVQFYNSSMLVELDITIQRNYYVDLIFMATRYLVPCLRH
jgi:hypothetical protein